MQEILQEFVDSRGVGMRVDRERGVLRGVKILGLHSRNGRVYREDALVGAVRLYDGAKVNVNHAKGNAAGPREYQDRLGVLRAPVVRGGEGLFADLHFNPKHALAEQLIWDAEHAPENVGLSHNVLARTAREQGQVVVEAITKVESVDLVADPATTRGLFEAERTAPLDNEAPFWSQLCLASLAEHRADLVEQIREERRAECEALRVELERLREATSEERRRDGQRANWPVAREQRRAERGRDEVLDARQFARSIQ